jgi:hypothetical protein
VSYIPTAALIVLGLIVLTVVLVNLRCTLRRFNQTVSMVSTDTRDRAGLLRARSAALRVAVGQRHSPSEIQ